MNKSATKFMLLSLALTAMCATSCVDNDYDLDNIDKTIGSNVNLELPSCSTGEIQLKNIIKLKEDGVVQLVDNPNGGDQMYVVCETGKADIKPIKIEKISIKKPQLSSINQNIDLREMLNAAPSPKRIKINVNLPVVGQQELDIPDAEYTYEVKPGVAYYNISGAEAKNINSDVLSIEKITVVDNKMTVTLKASGLPNYAQKIYLDNLKITYPKDINLTSVKYMGKDAKSFGNGEMELTGDKSQGNAINVSEPITIELGIDALQTGDNLKFDGTTHTANLEGKFEVTGTFRVNTADFDQAKFQDKINSLTAADLQTLYQTKDLRKVNGLIPTSINFSGNASFQDDIVVKKFTGRVQHEVGDISPIKLNNLPDFLNDDEVVLDLDNPMLFLNAATSIKDTEINTSIQLTSKYKDSSADVVRKTGAIGITNKATFWMANKKDDKFVPKRYDSAIKYTQLYDSNNKEADVTGLIKKIPNEIGVDVSTVTLDAKDLVILEDNGQSKEYTVDVDYEIYAPLAFGKEFMLVYQDTERDLDLGTDLDDLTLKEGTTLQITAKATSTLPTACNLQVIPLDKTGKQLTTLKPVSIAIDGKAKGQNVTINLEPTAGHKLSDALHSGNGQLDGIKYKAVLDKAAEGEVLTSGGNIILKDIKVKVKGQVEYDAN